MGTVRRVQEKKPECADRARRPSSWGSWPLARGSLGLSVGAFLLLLLDSPTAHELTTDGPAEQPWICVSWLSRHSHSALVESGWVPGRALPM